MDLNLIRSAVTLFSFFIFVVLMVWTYRPARRTGQEAAALLPLLGEAGFIDEGRHHE
ncbi:MAG: Cbb3-type cytochrome oxidase component FixQ [Pseudomonadota bacterium]|jgi:cbb3-type cytochrome oxidase subunit 3